MSALSQGLIRHIKNDIRPRLRRLDRQRRWVLFQLFAIFALLCWISLTLPVWLDLTFELSNISFILSLLLISKIKSWKQHSFMQQFNEEIVGALLRYFDDSLTYNVDQGVDISYFQHSELFDKKPTSYEATNSLAGVQGETAILMSEVSVEYQPIFSVKDETAPLFQGVLFMADFHKHFQGKTFIFPSRTFRGLGWFHRKLEELTAPQGTTRVGLENPDFEQAFVVYSNDPIEAHYLLSLRLVENILALAHTHKSPIRVSFIGTHIYIAIPREKPLFQPSFYRSVQRSSLIQAYALDLWQLLSIVEELDLNTRIWSKS